MHASHHLRSSNPTQHHAHAQVMDAAHARQAAVLQVESYLCRILHRATPYPFIPTQPTMLLLSLLLTGAAPEGGQESGTTGGVHALCCLSRTPHVPFLYPSCTPHVPLTH